MRPAERFSTITQQDFFLCEDRMDVCAIAVLVAGTTGRGVYEHTKVRAPEVNDPDFTTS